MQTATKRSVWGGGGGSTPFQHGELRCANKPVHLYSELPEIYPRYKEMSMRHTVFMFYFPCIYTSLMNCLVNLTFVSINFIVDGLECILLLETKLLNVHTIFSQLPHGTIHYLSIQGENHPTQSLQSFLILSRSYMLQGLHCVYIYTNKYIYTHTYIYKMPCRKR